ncbi:Os07g0144500 [Oryza sativa Japonica Group]|uniref:Os07g0144500 protein n=1 Tax=Oryza sativa subsp. japonica TaxID=39947 RepID=A0A0N7KMX5_ORYSJ|nr:hypothetical protein EE612_037087 [Oryza sativa]BAT00034.1 Os07g0144500 [Oryza sativa Japonica Group]
MTRRTGSPTRSSPSSRASSSSAMAAAAAARRRACSARRRCREGTGCACSPSTAARARRTGSSPRRRWCGSRPRCSGAPAARPRGSRISSMSPLAPAPGASSPPCCSRAARVGGRCTPLMTRSASCSAASAAAGGRPAPAACSAAPPAPSTRLAFACSSTFCTTRYASKLAPWLVNQVFGELTLRDTVRPVLVPCYDLATRAPFLFSRADAAQSPAYDFRLRDACAATCAPSGGGAAVEASSVDGVTRITAVGSGVALGNPTAAAITHVLNNRREFPAAAGVDNLLVISIGTGEAAGSSSRHRARTPVIARIAAEGASDMVDQAVAMAFGQHRTSNYVRIQTAEKAVWVAEAMLQQRNVEAVMFQGRRLAGETNAEKVERFARELIKEHGRRKQHVPPAASGGGGGGLDCHVSKKQP